MVRKVNVYLWSLGFLLLLCGLVCRPAEASSYSVYDGSLSSTYTQYCRDIIGGLGFDDHYIYFRSGQYEYSLIVGDIDYAGNTFTLADVGTIYKFSTDSGYNSTFTYTVSSLDSFSLSVSDRLVYSDLGNYPQLVELGSKYEILQTLILFIALLCVVVSRIFYYRKR